MRIPKSNSPFVSTTEICCELKNAGMEKEKLVDYLLELLGHRDVYLSDFFVFYMGGHSCVVESEILYKSLIFLSEKQKAALLLDF